MRWTPEKIAKLRDLHLGGLSARAAGDQLGVSASAAYQQGLLHGFTMRRAGLVRGWGEPNLRKRWATLIGPMKDNLRADIARIG